MFDLIAFDADDTLWHNENLYRAGEQRFLSLLARYPLDGDPAETLHATEIANLRYFGYGISGFVFSLIEAAYQLTGGWIASADLLALVDLAKEMVEAETPLFEHAEATLAALSPAYPLMLITKGDLLHQQAKIDRSGLGRYLRHVEIVPAKEPATYAAILGRLSIDPRRFLMVGNGLRSDILPVIEIGGWAVHIPDENTWAHESVDPPAACPRFFQIEHLGLLPGLIARLEQADHRLV